MPTQERPKSPSRLLPVIAVLLIVIGLAFRFLRPDEPEQPAPKPVDIATETERVVDVAYVEDPPAAPRDPALPFTPRATRLRTADSPEPNAFSEALAGEWQVFAGDANDEDDLGRAQLSATDSSAINVSGPFHYSEFLTRLEAVDSGFAADMKMWDTISARVEGDFNNSMTELVLSGVMRREIEGRVEVIEEPMHLRFVKVPEDQLNREAVISDHKREVKAMLEVFAEYAKDHGGPLPTTLDQLRAEIGGDAGIFEDDGEREIVYNPDGTHILPAGPAVQAHLLSPEELIAYDQELQRLWGADLYTNIPVFTVTYPGDELVYHASLRSGIDFEDLREPYAESDPLEMIERCMNNMKQFGLVAKMYENEHPQRLLPAGVYHVHPEYMPDPSILTCPAAAPGTLSYEVIFPALTEEELAAVYRQVNGIEADSGEFSQSEIPLVIERHLCALGEGSNVLFIDGHVERFTPDQFNDLIVPYLDARPR